jgi:hypothetical protein
LHNLSDDKAKTDFVKLKSEVTKEIDEIKEDVKDVKRVRIIINTEPANHLNIIQNDENDGGKNNDNINLVNGVGVAAGVGTAIMAYNWLKNKRNSRNSRIKRNSRNSRIKRNSRK